RDERGAGPDHQFRRGDWLPPQYRNNSYVVNNWRAHHLQQPPQGYQWVQSGADYLLVGIATGLIVDLLLNQ
ncbi:MAG: RcnB family protein, partial [Burkholderiaceae bacterium]